MRVAQRQLESVSTKQIEWEFIMRHLYSSTAAECAKVDIVDTLICEGGAPVHYLYTGHDGSVMARGRAVTLEAVHDEFLRLALAARGAPEDVDQAEHVFAHDETVCLAHRQGGDVIPLNLDKFWAMCKNGPPADLYALQAYVGRGVGCINPDGSDGYANLKHTYHLNEVRDRVLKVLPVALYSLANTVLRRCIITVSSRLLFLSGIHSLYVCDL
jgi:hypothetical protein